MMFGELIQLAREVGIERALWIGGTTILGLAVRRLYNDRKMLEDTVLRAAPYLPRRRKPKLKSRPRRKS